MILLSLDMCNVIDESVVDSVRSLELSSWKRSVQQISLFWIEQTPLLKNPKPETKPAKQVSGKKHMFVFFKHGN